jgi:hypothetical protein
MEIIKQNGLNTYAYRRRLQLINLKDVIFWSFFDDKAKNRPGGKKITKTAEDVHAKILKSKSFCFYAGKNSRGLISFRAVRIS